MQTGAVSTLLMSALNEMVTGDAGVAVTEHERICPPAAWRRMLSEFPQALAVRTTTVATTTRCTRPGVEWKRGADIVPVLHDERPLTVCDTYGVH